MNRARRRSFLNVQKIGVFVIATLALVGIVAAPAPAYSIEVPVVLTEPKLTQDGRDIADGDSVGLYSNVRFDASWSVSEVRSGDSFRVELPGIFSRLDATDSFSLLAPDGVTQVASCTWTDGDPDYAICTFGADYSSATGTVFFEMQATKQQSEQDVSIRVGGNLVVLPRISVDVDSWTPSPSPEKLGSASLDQNNNAVVNWVLDLPLGSTGAEVSDSLVQLSGDRPHRLVRSSFVLYEFTDIRNGVVFDSPGSQIEHDFTVTGLSTILDSAGFTGEFAFSDDLTFSGAITGLNPEHQYRILYSSASTDLISVVGDSFSNKVVLNGKEITTSVEARATAGGGASPSGYASFMISKQVVDPDSIANGVDSYPVELSYAGITSTILVPADGTEVSGPRVPAGTEIVLCEMFPALWDGVWEQPTLANAVTGELLTPFALGCFVLPSLTDVSLILTNTITANEDPEWSSFSVTKTVEGPAANLVEASTEFTVDYTVADDLSLAGTLTVAANGVIVNGPRLPAGSIVTLTEAKLPAIAGVTWGQPSFSGNGITVNPDGSASFIVDDELTVAVSLTNTAMTSPVQPGTPLPVNPLTKTGGDLPTLLIVGGALSLLLGAYIVFGVRRKAKI